MSKLNRRDFLKLSGSALIGMTLGGVALRSYAETPKVDPASPQASALKYVHDSAVEGQNCANCVYIQADAGEWRPCALFPGQAVSEKGWCAAWAKK
ncbi:MAG: high-potential iron-sulfur protein [Glaciecola sp.]|jgi:hypothetical protein